MACISDAGVSNLQAPGGQAGRGKMEVAMLRVATGRGRACGHATFRSERLKTLGLSAVRLDLAALTHARAGPRLESLAKSQPLSLGSSLSLVTVGGRSPSDRECTTHASEKPISFHNSLVLSGPHGEDPAWR